jgi:hypothetical protein
MRKILVIGSGASSKSTFSTRLGALLNIEVSKPKILKLLRESGDGKQIVWLRSRDEVERFLNHSSLTAAEAAA